MASISCDKQYLSIHEINSITEYRVKETPATIYYIPNFVTEDEEQQILDRVYKVPKPKWTQLSNRRLQNWGGIPHPNGMLVERIPEWLSMYLDKVWQLGVFEEARKPNHVLINEYMAGQGIMPHLDGPLFHPVITTLSLGSHTVLDFYVPRSGSSTDYQEVKMSKLLSLLVEPRSLLILKDEMYSKYLHGIEERDKDTLTNDICNLQMCEQIKSECQDDNTEQEDKSHISSVDMKDHDTIFEGYLAVESENKLTNIIADVQDKSKNNSGMPTACDFKMNSKENSINKCGMDKLGIRILQRKTRVSLTMRHVPKTSKVKLQLGH